LFLIFPQTEHSDFGFTEVLIGHWLSSFGKPLIAWLFLPATLLQASAKQILKFSKMCEKWFSHFLMAVNSR